MLQHLTDHAELHVRVIRRRRRVVLVRMAVMPVACRRFMFGGGIGRRPMVVRELMNDADGDLRQQGQQSGAQAEGEAACRPASRRSGSMVSYLQFAAHPRAAPICEHSCWI
jgi:hypothetical protein